MEGRRQALIVTILRLSLCLLAARLLESGFGDIQRLIDLLETGVFPQIDVSQICCMGNSAGGTATFYAACMDSRIRFAMPSCSVCTYEDSIAKVSHCTCNYIPGILHYF
ncbi:MAG: hypothetical protein ACLR23_07140 [Clostridia bacterium]